MISSEYHTVKRKNESRREYWKVKLSYDVDGKEYSAIKDYDYELKNGDTVKLEVYHSNDGSYKAAVTTSDAEYQIDNILFIASLGLGILLIIVSIVAALPDKKKI